MGSSSHSENDESRIMALLEQILDSKCSPEEACRDDSALLPAVRERLQQLRTIEAEVAAAFPPRNQSSLATAGFAARPIPKKPNLPGYDVEEMIGSGGMGVVYKARHLRLNRVVAVKMLLAGGYATSRELERFKREAEAVAALRHPSIVQIYDAGDHDGFPYFTMEFVEGGSLAQALDAAVQPPRNAAKTLSTLARAVQAAHAKGIVHRDLKPANILLASDGTLKITDFGLARRIDGQDGTILTLSGERVGTPSYMSPEQALGKTGVLGPSVDIYALGALLYELLTGRPPFRAASLVETQRQIIQDEPTPPSRINAKVPRDLETICLKCLAKDPVKRYATAADLADDVDRFLNHEPILARPPRWWERCLRWVRRRPMAAGLLAAVTLLVAGSATGAWLLYQRELADQARQLRTDSEVRGIVQQARGPLEEGWQSADVAELTGAKAEAARAVDIARSGSASAAVQQEAEAFQKDAVGRLDRAKMDRALLEAILDVSEQESSANIHDDANRTVVLAQPSTDAQYAAAFRQWGLDIDSVPEADAVERLRGEPDAVLQELVAGLDAWMLVRKQDNRSEEGWRRLFRIADRLDPNLRHQKLRALLVGDLPSSADAVALLTPLRKEIDPGTEGAITVVLLAKAFAAAGDGAAAEEILRQAANAQPNEALLLNALGQLLERQQPARLEEAIGYYRAARGQRRNLGIGLSRALDRAGRASEGEQVLRELLRQQPKSAAIYFYLGANLWGQRKLSEAESAFREAINYDAAFPEARINLGGVLNGARKYREAEAAIRNALELKPDTPEAYNNLGLALNGQQRLPDAESAFREAIKLNPAFAEGYVNLSGVLNDQRQYRESEAAARRAIELKPDIPDAHNNFGHALTGQRKLAEAESAFREAIKLNPKFALAYSNLGGVLNDLRKYAPAEEAFREAIELRPDFAEAYGNLGNVLMRQGKRDDADAAYRKAIELRPDFALAHFNLGGLMYVEGKLNEAEACFRKAVELRPDFGPAHCNLGAALMDLGRFDEAAAALKKGLELLPEADPQREQIQQQLERCQHLRTP